MLCFNIILVFKYYLFLSLIYVSLTFISSAQLLNSFFKLIAEWNVGPVNGEEEFGAQLFSLWRKLMMMISKLLLRHLSPPPNGLQPNKLLLFVIKAKQFVWYFSLPNFASLWLDAILILCPFDGYYSASVIRPFFNRFQFFCNLSWVVRIVLTQLYVYGMFTNCLFRSYNLGWDWNPVHGLSQSCWSLRNHKTQYTRHVIKFQTWNSKSLRFC